MATEKRLIDANALAVTYCDIDNRYNSEPWDLQEILLFLNDAPTVDAVQVVHGEWEVIEDDYFDLVELKCSVCGESWGFEDYEDCIPQNYHYCPNCGAKMDGGKDNG